MVKRKGEAKKIQNLENQLKRALADYANLQKRVDQEREQIEDRSKAVVITRFFNTLDTLELAEKAETKEDSSSIREGIEIAIKEFRNTLADQGVEEIDTSGDFDPRFHEAIGVVEGKVDDRIVEVLAKGYKIDERILRAARVKVSKKSVN